jgi:hypothetical protein
MLATPRRSFDRKPRFSQVGFSLVVRHFGRSPVCDWQVIGAGEKLFSAFFMRLQVNPAVSVPQRSPLGGVFFCAIESVFVDGHAPLPFQSTYSGNKKAAWALGAHAVHAVDRGSHQRFGVCRFSRCRNALAGGASAGLRAPILNTSLAAALRDEPRSATPELCPASTRRRTRQEPAFRREV